MLHACAGDVGRSQPNVRHITLVAAAAAAGGFLFGFDTSNINAAINGIGPQLRLSSAALGFVTAIALLGCAAGAWFAGPVTGRVGRTRVMAIAGALIATGSLGAAFVSHLVLMGIFRFCVGLGIGAASAVVPAYIAEISPMEIRGRLGSFWQFAIVFGQLIGLITSWMLRRSAGAETEPLLFGGAAWRWMFITVAIPAALYAFAALRLPPSPHRASTERVNLRALRGPRLGLQGIVWIGILIAAFQQLVGINVVKTYSTMLWRIVGFSAGASFGISIVTVIISIISTVVAIFIIDKVGRRPMLLGGSALMFISLAALVAAFSQATGSGDSLQLARGPGMVALVAMNVFAVAFGMTWGPVMWVLLGELFSGELRTSAVAICTAVNWVTNWLVTRTFPLLVSTGLGVAYGIYAVFALVALIFVWRVVPETSRREIV